MRTDSTFTNDRPASFLLAVGLIRLLFEEVFFGKFTDLVYSPAGFSLSLDLSEPNHKLQVLSGLSSLVNVLIIFISQ